MESQCNAAQDAGSLDLVSSETTTTVERWVEGHAANPSPCFVVVAAATQSGCRPSFSTPLLKDGEPQAATLSQLLARLRRCAAIDQKRMHNFGDIFREERNELREYLHSLQVRLAAYAAIRSSTLMLQHIRVAEIEEELREAFTSLQRLEEVAADVSRRTRELTKEYCALEAELLGLVQEEESVNAARVANSSQGRARSPVRRPVVTPTGKVCRDTIETVVLAKEREHEQQVPPITNTDGSAELQEGNVSVFPRSLCDIVPLWRQSSPGTLKSSSTRNSDPSGRGIPAVFPYRVSSAEASFASQLSPTILMETSLPRRSNTVDATHFDLVQCGARKQPQTLDLRWSRLAPPVVPRSPLCHGASVRGHAVRRGRSRHCRSSPAANCSISPCRAEACCTSSPHRG